MRDAATELATAARQLIEYARAGGAPSALCDAVAVQIVDALLELAERRRGDRGFGLAQRIARARADGVSIPDLQARFGRSRSQIYRLLSRTRTRQFSEMIPV